MTAGPLLANRRFLMVWIGQGASFAGDAISMVARLLPTLASPIFGVLADLLDRRTLLVAAGVANGVDNVVGDTILQQRTSWSWRSWCSCRREAATWPENNPPIPEARR